GFAMRVQGTAMRCEFCYGRNNAFSSSTVSRSRQSNTRGHMPKRPGSKLPNRGKWALQNPFFGAKPPFAILEINFDVPRGWVTLSRITTDAMHIHEIDIDKFNGAYQIWGNKGGFEAQIEDDQTLNMSFFGSVETTCRALPIE